MTYGGWPREIRPPEVFTGMRPPRAVSPDAAAGAGSARSPAPLDLKSVAFAFQPGQLSPMYSHTPTRGELTTGNSASLPQVCDVACLAQSQPSLFDEQVLQT